MDKSEKDCSNLYKYIFIYHESFNLLTDYINVCNLSINKFSVSYIILNTNLFLIINETNGNNF